LPLLGELAALFTAALWSGSAMVFAAATLRAGSFAVNVARLVFAALCLILLVAFMSLDVGLSGSQIVLLAISGIVGLAIGDSFLFAAFRHLGPRITMLIMSTAPAVAAILAYLVLDEILSFWGIAGIFVTLSGVGIVVLGRNEGASTDPEWRGIIFAIIAAAGQGVGLIFAKMAFVQGEVNSFVATLVRILASLLVMAPLVAVGSKSWDAFRGLWADRRAMVLTALGSVLGPFLGISFSLIAIAHTKVGVAAAIMATVPILMLPLVHFLHKERLTWKAIAGAVLAVSGVAILFLR
jgi:drug/metabolite transporter (DMT)-like permease